MNKFKNNLARTFAGMMMLALVAVPSVHALTESEIQMLVSLGIIPSDKAQAALASVSGMAGNSGNSCAIFTRNLTLGSSGADVVALQTYLESKGSLTIPSGVSKGYFGALTKNALAKYQASVGISPASGYFGPITRSDVSSKCGTPTTNPGNPNNPDLNGDEASLNDYDSLSKYSNENLEEGENKKVFAAEFKVEDGDIKLERVDVRVEAVNESKEDEPWNQIESMELYVNGKKIASEDVDNKNDWSREVSTDDSVSNTRAYEFRFTGLKEVIEEGEDVEIEIAVKASDKIDDTDLTQTWKIWVPTDGIRAIDGKGIQQYTGSNNESKNFSIEVADSGEVSIKESDDDLDSTILIVDTDKKSSAHEVFRFEIDADDADIFLNTLSIVASTSDDNIQNVVSELYVEIDGDEYNYDTASTTSNIGEYSFDFEDNGDEVTVEKDDTVEIVVFAKFNKSNGNYSDGTQVQFGVGKINGANYGSIGVTAEGQSTGDEADITGRQEGSVHSLRTQGIATQTSTSGKFEYVSNTNTTLSDDEGVYTFQVKITALEEDAWIEDSVSTTSSATAGFVTEITGDTFSGISRARISDTSADTKTNGRYKISEGTTETFEIVVELNPDASGAYGLKLTGANFADSSTNPQASYTFPDVKEFRISSRTIQN